jgi:hypothetical protein
MPLCDAEREIAKVVVHRFLTGKESTSKRLLVTRFRSPRALQRLVDLAILKRVGQTGEDFLPRPLAFHYSGDPEHERFARISVTVVLHVLQNLFDAHLDKTEFSAVDVEAQAWKMYDVVDSDSLKLGLYLVAEFGVLCGYSPSPSQTELQSVRIADGIVEIVDFDKAWDDYIARASVYVERGPEEEPDEDVESETTSEGFISVQASDLGWPPSGRFRCSRRSSSSPLDMIWQPIKSPSWRSGLTRTSLPSGSDFTSISTASLRASSFCRAASQSEMGSSFALCLSVSFPSILAIQ